MIYSLLANLILFILLALSIRWGLSRGKDSKQIEKNLDVLIDHSIADSEIRQIQESVSNKVIKAKNRNESDKVISHIFNVARNSKLSNYKK